MITGFDKIRFFKKTIIAIYLLVLIIVIITHGETAGQTPFVLNIKDYSVMLYPNSSSSEPPGIYVEILRNNEALARDFMYTSMNSFVVVYNDFLVSQDQLVLSALLKSIAQVYRLHDCQGNLSVRLALSLSSDGSYYIFYIECNHDLYKTLVTPNEVVVDKAGENEPDMIMQLYQEIWGVELQSMKSNDTMSSSASINSAGIFHKYTSATQPEMRAQSITNEAVEKQEASRKIILTIILPLVAGLATYFLLRRFLI
ncbi:MAG: hypothetical protein GU361_05425 [Desulfurococcales archaeon]|jgi:hypothetical protein|nr:hypothetical protein [Desulfurococcales archaeon]